MDKQNPMIMKQPDLGLKIVELRKAKGLTQEELVERCNINVRTIQRIEAGEVSPRSYTIKSIMDALGYDFDALSLEEEEPKAREAVQTSKGIFKIAFIVGIVYLVMAMVEGIMDLSPVLSGLEPGTPLSPWYVVVKIAVIGTYAIFMYGYYKMGQAYENVLVMVSSLLLILGTTFTLFADVYASYTENVDFLTVQIVKSVVLGAMYVALGAGLLKYQPYFGSMALVTAVSGIISGLAFLSVIFALPGLMVFTLFEILQLVLLYKVFAASREKKNITRGNIPAFG